MLTDLFGGPVSGAQVSCVALNAEIPWAGEYLLGTKSLSWQKGANPERKRRGPRPHSSQRMGASLGAGPVQVAHKHLEPGAVLCLTGLSPETSTSRSGVFLHHRGNSH